eukprot:1611401-Prymnesium_polylepis.1
MRAHNRAPAAWVWAASGTNRKCARDRDPPPPPTAAPCASAEPEAAARRVVATSQVGRLELVARHALESGLVLRPEDGREGRLSLRAAEVGVKAPRHADRRRGLEWLDVEALPEVDFEVVDHPPHRRLLVPGEGDRGAVGKPHHRRAVRRAA